MVFCGDLSVPNVEKYHDLSESINKIGVFTDEVVVINLEGVICPDNPRDTFWKVYNDSSVVKLKDKCRMLIFNLANNHMYDYPEYIGSMKQFLEENNVLFFGLEDKSGETKPLEFDDGEESYAFFGHCWNVYTKTNTNRLTDDKVVDCSYEDFYKTVSGYVKNNPEKKTICFFHWNFDLEKYPFPAYKRLSHDLIDAGVHAVIGNHAHVKQAVEIYKNKVIAYGLGNFYMPDGYYFDGELSYPAESHEMYMIKEKNSEYEMIECFSDVEEAIVENKRVKLNGDLAGDIYKSYKQYDCFFKKNRVKKNLVPVFYTYEDNYENKFKNFLCVERIKAIRYVKMKKDRKKRC